MARCTGLRPVCAWSCGGEASPTGACAPGTRSRPPKRSVSRAVRSRAWSGTSGSRALAARRAAAALDPRADVDLLFPARVALHSGRWQEADRLLEQTIDEGAGEARLRGLWWLALSLREQGRLRRALDVAARYRALLTVPDQVAPPYSSAVLQGAILLDLGRAHEAALLFDSVAVQHTDRTEGWAARSRAYMLTQRATALARAGDTAGLPALADAIRSVAAYADYGLVWNLDAYARALVLSRRGDYGTAVTELSRAVYSWAGGFSRVNLELGRALLAHGRARAAAALEAPLRGPIESGNTFVSRAHRHAEAGRAREAAGDIDAAAAHYRWVLAAWQNADPELHAQRDDVAARLAAIRLP